MRLLITGASGFVGGFVLAEALGRGHDIVAMIHKTELPNSTPASTNLEMLKFELGADEALDLTALKLDAVVHLVGALSKNGEQSRRCIVEGSRQLVDAAQNAGIGKIVCLSSIAAIDYVALPAMSTVDESAPVIDFRQGRETYATLKAEQEAVVDRFCEREDRQLVILRPGLVYDKNDMSAAHAGITRRNISLLASHAGEVPMIGARNLASAIIDALELEATGKQVMHLLDDTLPGQDEYIRQLRQRGGIGAVSVAFPWWMLAALAAVCRTVFAVVGLEGRLPELFTRAGFAGRLKPFRFTNVCAKVRLRRSFVAEY